MYYTKKELKTAKASIAQTAKQYGKPEAEVRTEIASAMYAGRADPDPAVQARWATFQYEGPEPTVEEFVAWCTRMVKEATSQMNNM